METVTTLGVSTVTHRSLFGPFASVTAPAPDVETMAQQLTSGLPTIGLLTDAIAVVAASDVDGLPGERTAQAAAAGTIALYLANVTWFAVTVSFSSSAEESGDAGALSGESIAVDALHLYLDDFAVFEDPVQRISFSGEIVFGHTEARLTAVPEPSSLALSLVGLLAAAGLNGRARR